MNLKELIKMSRTSLSPLPWSVVKDPFIPDKIAIMDAKEYYVIPPMDIANELVLNFIVACVHYANDINTIDKALSEDLLDDLTKLSQEMGGYDIQS